MEKISLIHTKQREMFEQEVVWKRTIVTSEDKEVLSEEEKEISVLKEEMTEVQCLPHVTALLNRSASQSMENPTTAAFDETNIEKWWLSFLNFKNSIMDGLPLGPREGDNAILLIYLYLEKFKNTPDAWRATRRSIIDTIRSKISDRSFFSEQDQNLLEGKLDEGTDLYTIRINSPKKHIIALFRHAMFFDGSAEMCPATADTNLCSSEAIKACHEKTKQRLGSLKAAKEVINNFDISPENIMSSIGAYLCNSYIQDRYDYSYKDKELSIKTESSSEIKYNILLNNNTQWRQIYKLELFDPLMTKAERKTEGILRSIFRGDEEIKNDGDIDFKTILEKHYGEFDTTSVFLFLLNAWDKPEYKNMPKFQSYFNFAKDSKISEIGKTASLSWTKWAFLDIGSKWLLSKYNESDNLNRQFETTASLIEWDLAGIKGLLQDANMGADKVRYPTEQLQKDIYQKIGSIHGNMTSLNSLLSTPNANITDVQKSKYRTLMTQLFLATSWLDPDLSLNLNNENILWNDLNIYSSILKNGWVDTSPYLSFFSDYINSLKNEELFAFANNIIKVGQLSGADRYDDREIAVFSRLMPMIYLKIGNKLIQSYQEQRVLVEDKKMELAVKRNTYNAIKEKNGVDPNLRVVWRDILTLTNEIDALGLDKLYDDIVLYCWVISGREPNSYADEKHSCDRALTFTLLEAPAGAIGLPILKYVNDLYTNIDKINNLHDCLLSSQSAASILEDLLHASGKLTRRHAHENEKEENNSRTPELRYQKLAEAKIPWIESLSQTNVDIINSIEKFPRWEEHFHNKLTELWFFNLGINFFMPEDISISGYIDMAKQESGWKKEKKTMQFFDSLSEEQFTEICLLLYLTQKAGWFSMYLDDKNIFGANQWWEWYKWEISWLSSHIESFNKNFNANLNSYIIQSYFSKNERWINELTDPGIALYYNILGHDALIKDQNNNYNRYSITLQQKSDEDVRKERWYIKTTALIVGWIAVGVATFWAGSALSLGAIATALAIGTTTTVYSDITRQNWYINPDDRFLDLGSQFLVNSATAFLGLRYFTPWSGVLSEMKNPKYFQALKYALADWAMWLTTEFARWKAISNISHIEGINWEQMITMWWLLLAMSVLGPSISSLAQKKIQGDFDGEADLAALKQAQEWVTAIEAKVAAQGEDAIKLELENTLVENGVSRTDAQKTANRLRNERIITKLKLKEMDADDLQSSPSINLPTANSLRDIKDVASVKEYLTELCASEEWRLILRTMADSEITAETTWSPLREIIAGITDKGEREQVAQIIFDAYGWDRSRWESGKAGELLDAAHKAKEIETKMALLRQWVKNGDINADIMKLWLRLNLCGINGGHYCERIMQKLMNVRFHIGTMWNVHFGDDEVKWFSDYLWIDVFNEHGGYQVKTASSDMLLGNTKEYIDDLFISNAIIVSVGSNSRMWAHSYIKNWVKITEYINYFDVKYRAWDGATKTIRFAQWGWRNKEEGNIHTMYTWKTNLSKMRRMYIEVKKLNEPLVYVSRGTGASKQAGIIPLSYVNPTNSPVCHGFVVEVGSKNGWKPMLDLSDDQKAEIDAGTREMNTLVVKVNDWNEGNGNLLFKPTALDDISKNALIAKMKLASSTLWKSRKYDISYSYTTVDGKYIHQLNIYEIIESANGTDVRRYVWWYSIFQRNYT